LVLALAAGDPVAAERDFSAQLRAGLPPALLAPIWRSLLAKYGPFKSSRVVTSDHRFDKDRFSLELEFAQRSLLGLVVFEPKTGQIIGLFFSEEAAAARTPSSAPTDPEVEEIALSVGAVPSAALGASLTLP